MEAGLASGLINTSQQIGGALGVAIMTAVATSRTDSLVESGTDTPQALTDGFSAAFWVGVAFAVASFIVTLVLLRPRELEATPAGAQAG